MKLGTLKGTGYYMFKDGSVEAPSGESLSQEGGETQDLVKTIAQLIMSSCARKPAPTVVFNLCYLEGLRGQKGV